MAQQVKGELLTTELPLTPAIAANLDCINFASVPQNGKASEIVYLKNVGREALIISEVVRPNTPFSIDEFDLPLVLNPGKKVSFVVTVTPDSMGDYSSVLQIQSNDLANPIIRIDLNTSIVEPEDEFAEKRAEMEQRAAAAKAIEDGEMQESEEVFADWVTPLKENRQSQAKNYALAFLLLVLLVGAIFYKYRTAPVQSKKTTVAEKATEPAEPNPQIKEHLEQTDTVKTKRIIMKQPNSYGSPIRKP